MTRDNTALFDEKDVKRFEQMFQTGNFDFTYRSDNLHFNANVLDYAALMGNLDRVKQLLELGADINSKNENGTTVLHCAAESGNLEIWRFS